RVRKHEFDRRVRSAFGDDPVRLRVKLLEAGGEGLNRGERTSPAAGGVRSGERLGRRRRGHRSARSQKEDKAQCGDSCRQLAWHFVPDGHPAYGGESIPRSAATIHKPG